MSEKTLYQRLGGYDGITAFVNDLLPRLQADALLGRFWENRGDDGIAREKQLLIDYLSANAGGSVYYTGRNMLLCHKGMGITEEDWTAFLAHAGKVITALNVSEKEADEIVEFVLALKSDIVD